MSDMKPLIKKKINTKYGHIHTFLPKYIYSFFLPTFFDKNKHIINKRNTTKNGILNLISGPILSLVTIRILFTVLKNI